MAENDAQRNQYVNNLKRLIKTSGYKLVDVANELQLPRSTLYGYISGRRPIPRQCLVDIVDFLARDIQEFRYVNVTALLAEVENTRAFIGSFPDEKDETERSEQATTEPAWTASLTPAQDLFLPATNTEFVAWFGKKLAYIVTVIAGSTWQRHRGSRELQIWVDKEIHMFDNIKPLWASDGYSMSRREAIIAIAALPTMLLTAVQNGHRSALVKQEFLFRCSASIAACWHLMAGRDFEEVEQAVTPYLPVLAKWAREPSEFQQDAAGLATQGSLLLGLVTLHVRKPPDNLQKRLVYCKQAVHYAKVTENQPLATIALLHLAHATGQIGRPAEMLVEYQEAALNLDTLSLVVQNKALSELAYAYAENGQIQEALRALGEARAKLPAPSDFVPVYVDFSGLPQQIQFEGLTHLRLGDRLPESEHYQQAWDALAQVEQLPPGAIIPERIRIELVNQQALVAVKLGDLDRFCIYLEKGVMGAKSLGSEKRRQEASDIYWQARRTWPNEQHVKDLADLFASLN